MNKELQKLLDSLVEKLEEEKKLIILSLKDSQYIEKLNQVIEEKREILSRLSRFEAKDFEGFKEKLEHIKTLSQINLNLAANNAQFIEEIFSSIFDEPKKYDQSGTVQQHQKGLFNKKI
ncbi:hypothetical protein SAMN06265182_1194 [Persephonella hydrogeniphila]|uniref:FlgN protein n=1 Tax=Persephonella hydrogeniphila TaxID=198703 RepID=A0A285NFC7_9AQUI|nr:hypothetical protein [Persephonella hydrogeniphila]SNZ08170.1 hypothetical protein SAMN06265182_1194 [Persephonella hydrogeniphila]